MVLRLYSGDKSIQLLLVKVGMAVHTDCQSAKKLVKLVLHIYLSLQTKLKNLV